MAAAARDAAASKHLREFGLRVRALRRRRELTQEALAHDAGLHRTVVGYIERAEREVGISVLWPLAAALGVGVSDLFDRNENSVCET
ncbi:helix-turn-helix domain-containing protein [Jatrophihabitans fulvus]